MRMHASGRRQAALRSSPPSRRGAIVFSACSGPEEGPGDRGLRDHRSPRGRRRLQGRRTGPRDQGRGGEPGRRRATSSSSSTTRHSTSSSARRKPVSPSRRPSSRLLRKGARAEDIRQGEEALRQAEANLKVAADDARRMRELAARGSVTPKQRDDAEARLVVAQAQDASAKEALAKLRRLARPEEVGGRRGAPRPGRRGRRPPQEDDRRRHGRFARGRDRDPPARRSGRARLSREPRS